MMFRKQWAAGLLLIGAIAFAGCGAPAQSAVQPATTTPLAEAVATSVISPLPTPAVAQSPLATPGAELADVSELLAALEAAGATVEMGDRIEQPFFEVQGQALTVNSQPVEVFEWADAAGREAVSQTITPEGQFGTTVVEWVSEPHFWASGKIIVLYVGEDAETVELLTGVVGQPITR